MSEENFFDTIQQELLQMQRAVVQTQKLVQKLQTTQDEEVVEALIGTSEY